MPNYAWLSALALVALAPAAVAAAAVVEQPSKSEQEPANRVRLYFERFYEGDYAGALKAADALTVLDAQAHG